MIPEAGQRFGPYEILGRLGSGGMGLVFRAWDERLHREVAVKLLHDTGDMPGMRERFLQEARAASALNHPNICTVFDIGEQDGDPYLVLELLEGETLKRRISRGTLSVEEIVRYAEEITEALSVAHAKGIVHRDLKPANIFLVTMANGRSQAKVLDFGLAKIELEVGGGWGSRTLDVTLAGGTVGTLAYMSPEQARGESLDGRSDLFSLGVVMYEMTTRRPPFRGTTSALMFAQLFDHEPEPMRNWNDAAPRDLERLILKLLAKDRRARFQTANEVGLELAKIHAKTSRRWLRKGAASAVPLVRADDPIARQSRSKQSSGQTQRKNPSEQVEAGASGSSADDRSIHPMSMQEEASASAEHSVQHSLRIGGLKQDALSGTSGDVSRTVVQSDLATALAQQAANERRNGAGAVSDAEREPKAPVQLRQNSTQLDDERNALELDESAPAAPKENSDAGSPVPGRSHVTARAAIAFILALAAVAGFLLLMRSGILRPMVLRPADRLLLTTVDNKTSDKSLDNTIMEGLEIALRQSHSLNVLGDEAYAAGLRQLQADGRGATSISRQSVAQKVGATAYVYGEITGPAPPYTIRVDIVKPDRNARILSMEEVAANRDDIPAAIGRLALTLRGEISGDGKSELRKSLLFSQGATGNLDALHAYAAGEVAMLSGRPEDALRSYRLAATLDPHFVQAQIHLAWLYRADLAELASSHAAELAKAAAVGSSDKEKMLAQFCYEMNAVGDYTKAATVIREYVAKYPQDVDGMKGLARVLLAQGYFPEALLAAQQGYREDRFDAEPYNEAEDALLGLGRYDSVLQLAAEAKRVGVVADQGVLAAAYLSGRDDVLAKQVSSAAGSPAVSYPAAPAEVSYAKLDSEARFLDSTGRLRAGLVSWRMAAAKAQETPELSSAASSMLAQGALDHAFAESCTVALAMADRLREMPKGPVATFNAGMAAALCGDQTYAEKSITALQQQFPENTTVMQDGLPELQAAADLGVNEPGKALQDLASARQDDRTILIPYLRGLATAALGQPALARTGFQTVLDRRGAAWMLAGTLYPMAEIDMARTYAAERDKAGSIAANRTFLALWAEADRRQRLMTEALARSR